MTQIPDKEPWEIEMDRIQEQLEAACREAPNEECISYASMYQILVQYNACLHAVLKLRSDGNG